MMWRLPFDRGSQSWPPLATAAQNDYPPLRQRFDELDAVLLPSFDEHDRAALEAQRRHRRLQLMIIVGAALTTVFGAIQAAVADQRWPGVVVAVLALVATAIANQQRRTRPLITYLSERAKAEELRSLYFGYLSGIYQSDVRALESGVTAVDYGTPTGERS